MPQTQSYDSLLYPKDTGMTKDILPVIKESSMNEHPSIYESNKVGGRKSIKKNYKIKNINKGTVIRRRKRKTMNCRSKSYKR